MSLVFKSQYLAFDHFHTDLQAFSTDIADNLVLVSEFCQFCHQIGAHIMTVLLQAIFFDSLVSKNQSVRVSSTKEIAFKSYSMIITVSSFYY